MLRPLPHAPFVRVGAALFVLMGATPARAGGQLAGDTGSQITQRAGAFVAKADDPTALAHNPAGLALLASRAAFFGTNLIYFAQRFDRTGAYAEQNVYPDPQPGYVGDDYPRVSYGGVQAVPQIAVAVPWRGLVFAAGVFTPHGNGVRDYDEQVASGSSTAAPAPQRYDIVSQRALIAFPSLAVAYTVHDRVRVGVRASWGVAALDSVRYVQGLSNLGEQPGNDTRVALSVRDWFVPTFGAGVHLRATDALELGVAYASAAHIRARGASESILGDDIRMPADDFVNEIDPVPDDQARCAPGGRVGALAACVRVNLPQMVTAGARWRHARGDVELDVRWEDWSRASDYRVIVDGQSRLIGKPLAETVVDHGFDDVLSVRLGSSWQLDDVELRGGVAYDTPAAPVTWTRLDADGSQRVTGAAGVGIALGRWRLDLGAAYVYSPRRIVRDMTLDNLADPDLRVQPDVPTPLNGSDQQPYHPFNAGTYESRYVIGSLGAQVTW